MLSLFRARKTLSPRQSLGLPGGLSRCFSLAEIEIATNNFDPDFVIGYGGFGTVYKGVMTIDGFITTVAIKCLSSASRGGVLFRREIQLLCQLRHHNLVPLTGFCEEKGHKIIVYKYMTHGSLDKYLCSRVTDPPLSWKQRLEICLGVARALHYIHTGAKKPIVHGDTKPTNILLDENWVPKLSGFGLSQMEPKPNKEIESVVGTYGYMDPEYAMWLSLTIKPDVYSFGILLLEVLCARKPYSRMDNGIISLLESIAMSIERGKVEDEIDPYLRGKIFPECLKIFVEIAMSCVLKEVIKRPHMGEVEVELEHAIDVQERAGCISSQADYTYEGLSIHCSPSLSHPIWDAFRPSSSDHTDEDTDDYEDKSEEGENE